MIDILYSMPSFLLFLFISLVFIGLSILATKGVHRYIPLKYRYQENSATVGVSAIIGIIYAILVGFTVLYELDTFDKAEKAEQEEAKTMFSIFRLALVLPEPTASIIRTNAISYAQNVIDAEWPKMTEGRSVNPVGISIIETIAKQIRQFKPTATTNPIQLNALNSLSLATNALFDLHQDRVAHIHTALSANLWFVLLLGSFLTIAINLILGMELRLHLVCMISVSLMVSAVIYLTLTLDRPYRGDFSVRPETFISTLEYIK